MKKLYLYCGHQKSVPDNTKVWVNGLFRCPKCNTLKKIRTIVS